jgi:hypothetical protein
MAKTVYCFSRNGAAIKCHDRIEDARTQAASFGLGDTAVGLDCIHPELPNDATYKVETLDWTGDGYRLVAIETVAIERDRGKARQLWSAL